MNPPADTTSATPDKDGEHLRLLAIFYFVHAAIELFAIGFGCLHYLLMRTIFARPEMWSDSKGHGPPPEIFFNFFMTFYVIMGTFFVIALIANVLCGTLLLKRKQRTFCMLAAGFTCLSIPLGTILGVFTILVLNRDSVRMKFAMNEAAKA